MNGLGTIAAACLGSPFPTTLYLGHAAHKANGARLRLFRAEWPVHCAALHDRDSSGSSPLCTAGSGRPCHLWFGLITVAQAMMEVPANQVIAVVLGLIPALAQWTTALADTVARKAGSSLMELAPRMGGDLALGGLIALGQGSLLTSMVWSAALALIVQRRFVPAAAWIGAAALLSSVGVLHAYKLSPAGVESHIGWGGRATIFSGLCVRSALPAHMSWVPTQRKSQPRKRLIRSRTASVRGTSRPVTSRKLLRNCLGESIHIIGNQSQARDSVRRCPMTQYLAHPGRARPSGRANSYRISAGFIAPGGYASLRLDA